MPPLTRLEQLALDVFPALMTRAAAFSSRRVVLSRSASRARDLREGGDGSRTRNRNYWRLGDEREALTREGASAANSRLAHSTQYGSSDVPSE